MKLYLDPGHGGTDPGASGNGLLEKDINLDIALRIQSILLANYDDIQIRMSRTSDQTKSLQQRTNEANQWGADYYVSIHCNAFNGQARGYEDFIHDRLSDNSQTANYRNTLHQEITKVNKLSNRGKKKANFHVLRETTMSAFLSENGFIDNSQDAQLMSSSTWRQTVAHGHANGIAKAFDLQPKSNGGNPTPDPEPGTVYRIIAGSFKSKNNADKRVDLLRNAGIESFVDRHLISGEVWYRVQAGAFRSRNNANQRLDEVKDAGINDAFITVN
ncbi:N-acetylmuramoyl-L-alanine amidase [Ornithinibacillus halophilus]|uniref:N-acetylmuramoyl-L-alanine amidase n=1 Tax=Ornithinibacillus halophilus TaxID=930117 RepID=A0A1M5KAS5_9BACI|nr:N-acetylmuramoyl-L-alanine amidase [Ornithinibacillus halophilus]SHG49838.1 N-acetylmuramoyl-L-alanine amidase [Ornithinibacillus halophilus]